MYLEQEEYDEVYNPSTIGELCLLTRRITNEKTYLLIESLDKQPVLVDILSANSFNLGVDLISDIVYNKLTVYFNIYGAIATINQMIDTIGRMQRN